MAEQQIALSNEEREYLTNLLQSFQKEKRVEEHRTRDLLYRGVVIKEEDLIASLLNKLGSK
jgi:hypothetical protein